MSLNIQTGVDISSETKKEVMTIDSLHVRYPEMSENSFIVKDINLTLNSGEITGLVGESGSGKSTTAIAAIGFKRGNEIVSGRVFYKGENLLTADSSSLRKIWGAEISYVAQSASLSLNPVLTIETQLSQPIKLHLKLRGRLLRDKMLELLCAMEVPNPEGALSRYPFQFSGGQQQRIALAIALACNPRILILDEPTTGLDVTTQAKISGLLRKVSDDMNIAVLYISHDLALLNSIADKVAVMFKGELVETGSAKDVLNHPKHPYTQMLVGITPRLTDSKLRSAKVGEHVDSNTKRITFSEFGSIPPLLIVDQLELRYPGVQKCSVDKVSFKLVAGQRLAVVGESGSGKSSILKAVSGLVSITDGYLQFSGRRLGPINQRNRVLCGEIQLIFQNPDSSLNKKQTIRQILSRPLILFRPDVTVEKREHVITDILEKVGLPRRVIDQFPKNLSGGQKQRIAIARAFLAKPKLLLCDEITSALDVSVQSSIMKMLADMTADNDTAVIFVSHDLPLVKSIADDVIVMKHGQIVEYSSAEQFFLRPSDPYSRELMQAIPNY